MAVEVKCINKTNHLNPHERIEYIGGFNSDGTRWRVTHLKAIQGIEKGTWQFYVNTGAARVDVIVAVHNAHKYIKTKNDGLQPDNLLNLPECPI